MEIVAQGFQPLLTLGLSQLEARIYVYLLQNSPATGYKVAKELSQPTANTYKALQRLFDKGAIVIEDGFKRLCRAVPAEEFLARLDRLHAKSREDALAELSNLKSSPHDERVYHLKTVEQVYQRFRRLLKYCERIALLDLFPEAVEQLKSELEAAARRGVIVVIKVYRPVEIPRATIVVDPDGADRISRWQCIWANGVFDGREHLLSLISGDGESVHQAVWSSNIYVSWVYHSTLSFEILYTASENQHEHPDAVKKLKEMICLDCDTGKNIPGYIYLKELLSGREASETRIDNRDKP